MNQPSAQERITLPNQWSPRDFQLPVFQYFQNGGKRAVLCWHRRSGKDDFALHWTAVAAMQRPGNYWHCLPEYGQARKAIWEAVNPRTGKRRIDEAFPEAIRETPRTQEMMIKFINGATWQLVGSDNYDSLVGSPPVGIVFSEYALANPSSWAYLRPILADNGGWAIFISTMRGKNHFYKMCQMAEASNDDLQNGIIEPYSDRHWYYSKVTADKSGVFTKEQLEQELKELIAEYGEEEGRAKFNQEYMCSAEGSSVGAYFINELMNLESDGRLGSSVYDPNLPVSTGWDIGVGDSMAIVFIQRVGMEYRLIDYYEATGESIQTAVRVLKEKPYIYDQHVMPHDISVREWTNEAKTRYQTALELGVKPITLVKRTNKAVDDRIHAIRTALPRMVIDKRKCAVLFEHLKNYKKKWNRILKQWDDKPDHGPESHGVDALGTYLTGVKPPQKHRDFDSLTAVALGEYQGVW